jgi:hypothetical protein
VLKGGGMDETTKKMVDALKLGVSSAVDETTKKMADAMRSLDPSSISEEIARATGAAAQKLVDLSSVGLARKSLEEMERELHVKTPSMPYIAWPNIHIPTDEEKSQFQGSAVLLRRLAESIRRWRCTLPDGMQPAVFALLNSGVQIDVKSFAQESFHGIRIEGEFNGTSCVVLAHQSSVQLLCMAQPIQPPVRPYRAIGFMIEGQVSEA